MHKSQSVEKSAKTEKALKTEINVAKNITLHYLSLFCGRVDFFDGSHGALAIGSNKNMCFCSGWASLFASGRGCTYRRVRQGVLVQ